MVTLTSNVSEIAENMSDMKDDIEDNMAKILKYHPKSKSARWIYLSTNSLISHIKIFTVYNFVKDTNMTLGSFLVSGQGFHVQLSKKNFNYI